MAAMATSAAAIGGMARLLAPPTPRPAAPSSGASSSSFSSFPPLRFHGQSARGQLKALHVAFARNVPAERKSVTATPAEPEMSPAELKAYEEACAKLEGTTPDFWEGETWNPLGFIVQYMWAFGVAISIVGCLIAVRSYNSGATDFKNTEVFKEAIEFQVESGEGSGSSPFEEAP